MSQDKEVNSQFERQKVFKASAPGSLMLMGEHAVLYGHKALVFAIDKRIRVSLTPILQSKILIRSQLGKFEINLVELETDKNVEFPSAFKFVMTSIKHKYAEIKQKHLQMQYQGFELFIESEFTNTLGLGSSAAVVIATLAVLEEYMGERKDNPYILLKNAHAIVHSVQGIGSGADLAASLFGGIIHYHYQPRSDLSSDLSSGLSSIDSDYSIESLDCNLPMVALYSGSKTPTPIVVKQVAESAERYPTLYQSLYQAIGECVQAAVAAIKKNAFPELGKLMNTHHALLSALGVSNQQLDEIYASLNNMTSIYGAKISGAGLGDCVIGLGKFEEGEVKTRKEAIQFAIEKKGLCYES